MTLDLSAKQKENERVLLVNEDLLNKINEGCQIFLANSLKENAPNLKLGFLSSVFREFHLSYLELEQEFEGTHFECDKEKFSVILTVENHNTEDLFLKQKMEDKIKTIQEEQQSEFDFTLNPIVVPNVRVNSLWSQPEKIIEFYFNVLNKVKDEIAAINLVSFLLVEFEILSVKEVKRLFVYNDLYDKSNPLDKWFASIFIERKEVNHFISYQSNWVH